MNVLIAGVLYMAAGMLLIPVGDGIAKLVQQGSAYSPQSIAWVRFLVGALLLLPLTLRYRLPQYVTFRLLYMQAIRALLIVCTVTTIIKAVGLSPIADVFGAFFIGPAVSVFLSKFLLRANVTRLEWLSVIVGFIGVLLVVQPGFLTAQMVHQSDPILQRSAGLQWALLSGVFYGAFLVSTRWASASGPPILQVIVQFLLATLILTPFALPEFIELGIQMPMHLGLMGLSSVLANVFSVMALSRASNAFLAPVVYTQVIAATVIGLWVFGDSINAAAAVGLAVIVLSGCLKIRKPAKRYTAS